MDGKDTTGQGEERWQKKKIKEKAHQGTDKKDLKKRDKKEVKRDKEESKWIEKKKKSQKDW